MAKCVKGAEDEGSQGKVAVTEGWEARVRRLRSVGVRTRRSMLVMEASWGGGEKEGWGREVLRAKCVRLCEAPWSQGCWRAWVALGRSMGVWVRRKGRSLWRLGRRRGGEDGWRRVGL